jgi:sensor histidine kinase regulating citrate/malate metabolism
LFIILGNAIDNAIEECNALPAESERYINISIRQKAQLVVMKVDNPCRESQTAKPGYIHGYGLKNVRRCVEKYHGELQYGVDHGVFHFFALLNLV